MDIASLLAAADEEVEYDKDDFEDTDKLQLAIEQSNDTKGQTVSSPKKGSAASILAAAAQTVAKEERQEAAEIFNESAKAVVAEVRKAADPDASALEILIEASKEVNTLHNIANPATPESSEDEAEEDGLTEDDEEHDAESSRDLVFACHNGEVERVRKLLRKNADILHRDRHGWTGLHWAAARGHCEVIEELVAFCKSSGKKLKTLLHAQDALAGWTPLHVACVSDQLRAAELLVELGASKRKKDRMNERAADVIAGKKNARAMRALFEEKSREVSESPPPH